MNDEPDRDEMSPLSFTSHSLSLLAPFFRLAAQIPPTLLGFARQRARYNTFLASFPPRGHWLILCYKRNFNSTFIHVLDHYVAKLVYLQGQPSDGLLEALRRFRLSPVLVCERAEAASAAGEMGLDPIPVSDSAPSEVQRRLGFLFSQPPEALLAAGFHEDEIIPARFVAANPGHFLFGESMIPPVRCYDLRLLRPNETLANRLRQRLPPAKVDEPPAAERERLLIESINLVRSQKVADYLISQGSDDPDLAETVSRAIAAAQADEATGYEPLLPEISSVQREYTRGHTLIVAAPALNRRAVLRQARAWIPNRILKYFFRHTTSDYLHHVDRRDFKTKKDLDIFGVLMAQLASDNEYLSNMLTLLAEAFVAPVWRVPRLPSAVFGRLRHMHTLASQGDTGAFKISFDKLGNELASSLPPKLIELFRSDPPVRLKIVSDLPVEWSSVDGVPLLYRVQLSRTPLTPGNNLLAEYGKCQEPLVIGEQEFKRILVVNCFDSQDVLADYPRRFADSLAVPHTYTSASSPREYRDALARHRPVILVHWGHGSYDRFKDRGVLHFGQDSMEVWELRDLAVPPIVLLASCETAAIAETHNTPANAWLAQGARAVLASYFPIDADVTWFVLARVIANANEAIAGHQVLETWESVVHKTLVLNRYLDYLSPFNRWTRKQGHREFPAEVMLEFSYRWNRSRVPVLDRYNLVAEMLKDSLRHFGEDLSASFDLFLRTRTVIPHTLCFTHLGWPETIAMRKTGAAPGPRASAAEEYWTRRSVEDQVLRSTAMTRE